MHGMSCDTVIHQHEISDYSANQSYRALEEYLVGCKHRPGFFAGVGHVIKL